MWLATRHGFFSIVKKDKNQYHVRARVGRDLENLRAAAAIIADIKVWAEADYRYRMIVSRQQLAKVMRALEGSIDYDNFKNKIAATPDQRPKLDAYHRIWYLMQDLQRSPLP